jgi:hypothetical protein
VDHDHAESIAGAEEALRAKGGDGSAPALPDLDRCRPSDEVLLCTALGKTCVADERSFSQLAHRTYRITWIGLWMDHVAFPIRAHSELMP